MLRKKDYKDEEHFSQYHSALVPRSNGSKLTLYYKRYRPAQAVESTVYSAIHNTKPTTAVKS